MSDTRLSRMLHVLVHMHLLGGSETSETIAKMLNTNPVVVRRTMAALRDHGIVTSAGGRSGGWRFAKEAAEITVEQVHDALQAGSAFSIALSRDHSACPVESAANAFLAEAMADAETTLRTRFAGTTIRDLASAFV
ncbi:MULTISPECIES: RrF2 family transcriptional regulator [Pseudorhizobium]|uniref:Rrf2 family transcriptional regulator n=1 Tax=Pseudorhizobium pelagicum TaxID=1509405 RepID=A0A922T9M7_9HYPH|nr:MULTISPECIES: Rrf2 family transcriptional regulator [Pseudorhizobium]KEQ07432.1 Rrf2 family transcriptional regulator [Pseudorhizobium pelagicum]KEQ09028.1 Rrf2 family transcriptional regulator [Pseudorhizobium pelagicum]MDY6963795.1 Rrf2 family transcriptional regulator [Pseudomonadota bacterium]